MDSSGPVWRIQRETRSQTFNLRPPCYCKLADFVRNFHSKAGSMFSEGDKKYFHQTDDPSPRSSPGRSCSPCKLQEGQHDVSCQV